jgi:hypothetical protein
MLMLSLAAGLIAWVAILLLQHRRTAGAKAPDARLIANCPESVYEYAHEQAYARGGACFQPIG